MKDFTLELFDSLLSLTRILKGAVNGVSDAKGDDKVLLFDDLS